MIYLIGGPPKCGKTTLAKKLSKSERIPWVSTDTLQCVIMPFMNKKDLLEKFPTSTQRCNNNDEKYDKYSTNEIIDAYQKQAKTSYKAIDMFAISEITEGNDFIIEGYHVEPELIVDLQSKYPNKIKSVFLVKANEEKFIDNINKSTTPNDWIIERTNNKETYNKISKMICEYSKIIEKECKKHGFKVVNMDDDFDNKIVEAIEYLMNN